MLRKTIRIKNASQEDIYLDLRHREDAHQNPVVVIIHGFKGFKDWGFFPELSERLALAGYIVVTPNLSRNGIGYDYHTFQNLDKFAQDTHSHELDDIRMVIKHIQDGKIARNTADISRLALLGHSRGGGSAVLLAAELGDQVATLVTWAAVDSFYRYSPEQIAQWEKNGFIEIENSRTKQMMRINKTFWDDLSKNKKKFDILAAAQKLENPALFVHGKNDVSVDPSEAENLHEKCASYVKRLELIEEAGHTFNIKHPMEKSDPAFDTACDITENWLDNYLNI